MTPLVFTGAETFKPLTVSIIDDGERESNTPVTVTLVEEQTPGTTYYVDSANNTASVLVIR